MNEQMKSFEFLWEELRGKVQNPQENAGSRTVKEFQAGAHAIGKKIVEEAAEVWMAAEFEGNERCAEEISQLLYHLQVLMLERGISLEEVYNKL
jgi:phosphoribosyl-ATP pyrophosphohydrolase